MEHRRAGCGEVRRGASTSLSQSDSEDGHRDRTERLLGQRGLGQTTAAPQRTLAGRHADGRIRPPLSRLTKLTTLRQGVKWRRVKSNLMVWCLHVQRTSLCLSEVEPTICKRGGIGKPPNTYQEYTELQTNRRQTQTLSMQEGDTCTCIGAHEICTRFVLVFFGNDNVRVTYPSTLGGRSVVEPWPKRPA